MAKRIFIGIPASKQVQEEALEFCRLHQNLPVRWVKSHNLHITLLPPWEADSGEIAEIIGILKAHLYPVPNGTGASEPLNEPFSIRFDSAALGPNPREPRLIWATGQTPDGLIIFKKTVEKSLAKLIHIPHGRELYKLHMTLARIDQGYARDNLRLDVKSVNWPMTVDRFALYESLLKPEGAEYEVIGNFDF